MALKAFLRWLGINALPHKIKPAEPKISENKGISVTGWGVLIYSLIMIGLGILIFLLLRGCPGSVRTPPSGPDTLSTIEPDSSGQPQAPELPDETGEAKPTRDTTWLTDTIHVPIPLWSIQLVDYRDATLKIAAVRPLRKDSVEVYSATWYAPGGFQVRVRGDSIRVDTFPMPTLPTIKPPKKKLICYAGLAEFDTQDGIGIGVEASVWKQRLRLQALIGAGRIYSDVDGTNFPANPNAPWLRLRLQIKIP